MELQERYRKHKTFIENRWQPIDVKVILEEDPENKISIIREEKKRAANEIQDQDELHAFLEYLDGELKWHEAGLNQNDLSSASQTAQNNEPLNTDESTQESQNTWSRIEKINWRGTETQLVFWWICSLKKLYLNPIGSGKRLKNTSLFKANRPRVKTFLSH